MTDMHTNVLQPTAPRQALVSSLPSSILPWLTSKCTDDFLNIFFNLKKYKPHKSVGSSSEWRLNQKEMIFPVQGHIL